MYTMLHITLADGEYRIDSRLVAQSLGIEHESFMRTIGTYQAGIEELGLLRFEIGVKSGPQRGKMSHYVLLNEDQAIFLATLSRNTSQVVAFKLKLTKAFSEAPLRLQVAHPSVHALTERLRPRAMENLGSVPDGYFSVMGELFKHLYNAEPMLNRSLDEQAMIEIPVGQRWSRYARETAHVPDHLRRTYPHVCLGGRIEQVWAYPIAYGNTFAKWLWEEYFPAQLPDYQRYRARHVALPAPLQGRRPTAR